jgi:predicted secreted hydrolase
MDHEFGASLQEKDQAGWDRFSIQLDDGTDLMLLQFRGTDGARKQQSIGTIVDASGTITPIKFNQFDLEPTEHWESTTSGARYPIGWRMRIPGREIELSVRAALDDQEPRTAQSTGLIWWQGVIEITGTDHGRPVRGRGYLEMTGYAAE